MENTNISNQPEGFTRLGDDAGVFSYRSLTGEEQILANNYALEVYSGEPENGTVTIDRDNAHILSDGESEYMAIKSTFLNIGMHNGVPNGLTDIKVTPVLAKLNESRTAVDLGTQATIEHLNIKDFPEAVDGNTATPEAWQKAVDALEIDNLRNTINNSQRQQQALARETAWQPEYTSSEDLPFLYRTATDEEVKSIKQHLDIISPEDIAEMDLAAGDFYIYKTPDSRISEEVAVGFVVGENAVVPFATTMFAGRPTGIMKDAVESLGFEYEGSRADVVWPKPAYNDDVEGYKDIFEKLSTPNSLKNTIKAEEERVAGLYFDHFIPPKTKVGCGDAVETYGDFGQNYQIWEARLATESEIAQAAEAELTEPRPYNNTSLTPIKTVGIKNDYVLRNKITGDEIFLGPGRGYNNKNGMIVHGAIARTLGHDAKLQGPDKAFEILGFDESKYKLESKYGGDDARKISELTYISALRHALNKSSIYNAENTRHVDTPVEDRKYQELAGPVAFQRILTSTKDNLAKEITEQRAQNPVDKEAKEALKKKEDMLLRMIVEPERFTVDPETNQLRMVNNAELVKNKDKKGRISLMTPAKSGLVSYGFTKANSGLRSNEHLVMTANIKNYADSDGVDLHVVRADEKDGQYAYLIARQDKHDTERQLRELGIDPSLLKSGIKISDKNIVEDTSPETEMKMRKFAEQLSPENLRAVMVASQLNKVSRTVKETLEENGAKDTEPYLYPQETYNPSHDFIKGAYARGNTELMHSIAVLRSGSLTTRNLSVADVKAINVLNGVYDKKQGDSLNQDRGAIAGVLVRRPSGGAENNFTLITQNYKQEGRFYKLDFKEQSMVFDGSTRQAKKGLSIDDHKTDPSAEPFADRLDRYGKRALIGGLSNTPGRVVREDGSLGDQAHAAPKLTAETVQNTLVGMKSSYVASQDEQKVMEKHGRFRGSMDHLFSDVHDMKYKAGLIGRRYASPTSETSKKAPEAVRAEIRKRRP